MATSDLETFLEKEGVNLEQFGVKGMKWGVRRSPAQLAAGKKADKETEAKEKAARQSPEHKAKTALKAKPVDEMTNQELQTVITRMNLEKQYATLNPPHVNPGKKFMKELVVNVAKKQVTDLANDQASKAVKAGLAKAAAKKAAAAVVKP